MRVGVFICHCGANIAAAIDIKRLAEFAAALPHVAVVRDFLFMCSESGFDLVRRTCHTHKLDAFIIAACSPRMHLHTFRRYATDCGLNPYLVEMANIREHAAWVVQDKNSALKRAKSLILAALLRLLHDTPLEALRLPVKPSVLVVGGGIAGIEASLTLADGGVHVHLVERSPSIGGHMARLDKVFPTLDCAACILTPKMSDVARHKNITLHTMAELTKLEGVPGAFLATIKKQPRFVDETRCIGCGLCTQKCPVKVADPFNEGLSQATAIRFLFAQAVPRVPFIQPDACLKLTENRCGNCAKVCPVDAVRFNDTEKEVQLEVGLVLVAVGYRLFDVGAIPELGWRRHGGVLTSLEFERMLSADGPTGGRIVVPTTGRPPRSVAILHCVGSRDTNYAPYCSRVCCMAALKYATLIRQKCGPKTAVYNLYIDMRCHGKGYEEFYNRAAREGVHFIRGKAVRVLPAEEVEGLSSTEGDLVVVAEDTLAGRLIHVPADMVVLCPAMVPPDGLADLARILRVSLSGDGFLMERHPKLDPTRATSEAIHIAGCCQGPKEIQESVSQAAGSAAAILAQLKKGLIEKEPIIAIVDESLCIGCGLCVEVCPYGARELRDDIAVVVEARCEGCGSCGVACPSGATTLANMTRTSITEAASVIAVEGAG